MAPIDQQIEGWLLTDGELEHLIDLLNEELDEMIHYREQFSEDQFERHDSLSRKAHDEARKRKLWWAR